MPSLTVIAPALAEAITAVRAKFTCTPSASTRAPELAFSGGLRTRTNAFTAFTRIRQWPAALLLTLCVLGTPAAAIAEGPKVTLSTTKGDILLELDAERAPQTVRNFLEYVDSGFYTDTLFHRVIEGFMIQGGGFDKQYRKKSTRAPVSNEAYNGLHNRRYTIAMARTTAPHSATSQFFINSENNSNLDHTNTTQRGWGYTVFGRVIAGEEVVDAISRVRTDAGGPFSRDVPAEPIVILSASRYEPSQQSAAEPAAQSSAVSSAAEVTPAAEPASQSGAETGSNNPSAPQTEQN